MIYVAYVVLAAIVVFLSIKAAEYVDLLDKKTKISGAFIGGVMLSAVTSLPELFTSLSAVVWLKEPGLCIGNILGSDLFNLAALAVFMLIFYKKFRDSKIGKSHFIVNIFILGIYAFVILNYLGILDLEVITISVTSIVIIILYILGVKFMAGDNEADTEEPDTSKLTVKQVVIRFILASLGIVAASIAITYVTDIIAEQLGLGAGLAGALFLGIATSLPEVTSTISLFKIGNINVAIGNIIGSNIFNFLILGIADIVCINGKVFDFSDPKTINLMIFGAIAAAISFFLLKFKNKVIRIICPIGLIACYVLFLVI